MTSQGLLKLLLEHKKDSALLLGNGINRYTQSDCSWEALLKALAKTYCPSLECSQIPDGITNTEFFDFLEITILREIPTCDKKKFPLQRVSYGSLKCDFERIHEYINRMASLPPRSFDPIKSKESLEAFNSIRANSSLSDSVVVSTIAELGDKFEPAVNNKLTRSICSLMNKWIPSETHRSVAKFAKKNEIPILTTNYDNLLGQSVNAKFYDFKNDKSSEEHPISCCYTTKRKPDVDKFGIWHINGMIKYPKSILIGLTHYMRAIDNIRSAILPSNKFNAEIFQGNQWGFSKLSNTWISIVFRKKLFIFGLSLNSDEVFLRWLLIERAKFFALFPYCVKQGWYIATDNEIISPGKSYFLKSANIDIIRVPDYSSIYDTFAL